MKYHSLFHSKIGKDVIKFVVCCSRDCRFKGLNHSILISKMAHMVAFLKLFKYCLVLNHVRVTLPLFEAKAKKVEKVHTERAYGESWKFDRHNRVQINPVGSGARGDRG